MEETFLSRVEETENTENAHHVRLHRERAKNLSPLQNIYLLPFSAN